MMTGKQFKAIRRFNRITQEDVKQRLNFSSRSTVAKMESDERIPERYVKVLQDIIGINLTDQEVAEKYYDEIPEKWKKPVVKNSHNFFTGKTVIYPENAIL